MYEIITDYVFPAKAKAILNQENLLQKSEKCNTYSFPNATVLPAKKQRTVRLRKAVVELLIRMETI